MFVELPRIGLDQGRPGEVGGERCRFDQLQEPAVKGVDRERRLGGQHLFVQRPGAVPQPVVGAEAAFAQKSVELCIAAGRQIAQPANDALLDLARGLAREGDRQNFAGCHAGQQQPHDTRSQQPGLATASAGLDDDAARRIERLPDQRRNALRHSLSDKGR